MMDITKAIRRIHPAATGWILRGDDYAGLDWFDEAHAKPSLGELQDAWNALVAEIPDAEKKAVLVEARANREIVLDRLTGHRVEAREAIILAQEQMEAANILRAAAVAAEDAAGVAAQDAVITAQNQIIAAQRSDLAGIADCKQSLLNMFADARVIAASDVEVKDVLKVVYAEIVTALFLSAPRVVVAFKGLDAL